MNNRSYTSVSLALLLFLAPAAVKAEILYSVTDLGTLGGDVTQASALNNTGQVTGFSSVSSSSNRPFLYSNGGMIDLGELGVNVRNGYGQGYGINDSGQVVGVSNGYVFLYSDGQLVNLGTGVGQGVNDSGQVAGFSQISVGGPFHAFLYSNGQMTDLGTLGGDWSYGRAINKVGHVAGYAQMSSGAFHTFLYSDGQMFDLGTLGGIESAASAINNAGQLTGYAQTSSGDSHAFLFSNGQMTDLGTLGGASSWGLGINEAGHVVGYGLVSPGEPHAFLYRDGKMRDLNALIDPALAITLGEARSINDHGQIVANSFTVRDHPGRAYLLTPTEASCQAPVFGDVSATPNVLWPPNHRFVQVAIGYTVDDACRRTCELTVSSNEPVKGKGDGNNSTALRVIDAHQLELRAERDGNGSGRVYTVSVGCVNDRNQLSSTKTVSVSVPHDEGH